MDLVKLYDEQVIYSFVNDYLGERVLFRSMCITQAYLLVVMLIVTNSCAVEVALIIFEPHPKNTI